MTSKEKTLKNLKKVYNELPKLAEKIPSIKTEFDMALYGVFFDISKKEVLNNECDTCGCGLGNAARLFDLNNDAYYDSFGQFNYDSFGRFEFPYLCHGKLTEKIIWEFLFSQTWNRYQPLFEQFIERVKYAIDMDLEIGDWDFQEESFKVW